MVVLLLNMNFLYRTSTEGAFAKRCCSVHEASRAKKMVGLQTLWTHSLVSLLYFTLYVFSYSLSVLMTFEPIFDWIVLINAYVLRAMPRRKGFLFENEHTSWWDMANNLGFCLQASRWLESQNNLSNKLGMMQVNYHM